MSIVTDRPYFATADDWLASAWKSIELNRPPWEPMTTAELELAVEHLPEHIWRHWLPSPDWLEIIGLPRWFGRVEPWDDEEQERFLKTLQDDDEFRRAVRAVLEQGGAE